MIAGTVLLAGALSLLQLHKVGNAMQASSQNQLAAYYMGIPVKRINSLIWALSAIVATIAGVLLSPVSLVDPSIGFLGIKAFAAAVVGGFGSLLGTVLGGLIVGISETLAGRYLPPGFKEIVAYLIMLAVLLVRPQGLFSTMQRKKVGGTACASSSNLLPRRHPPFPAWRQCLLLRPPRRVPAVAPAWEFYVGALPGVHLAIPRRADAADRLHRARQPGAWRLHGDRRVHQHLSDHQRRAVPRQLSDLGAGGTRGRHCRGVAR
jgi:hypothetical protein